MFVSFFFLFLLTDGASSEEKCAYQDVINHLGLTYNNKTFFMTRPVANYRDVTQVSVWLHIYAILEVREKDQIFVPHVGILLLWRNEFIRWNKTEFCGITNMTVPADLMWKPDITIQEMTESDKSKLSTYVTVFSHGYSIIINDHRLVCTCKIQVYRFPFDTQSCSLTFRSFAHSDKQIEILPLEGVWSISEVTNRMNREQSEWEFIVTKVTKETVTRYMGIEQSVMNLTIYMRRSPALYVVNFILPILFFLCLDLASFLISDTSGEKLGFKVTVLLAVTVMQLILNDILPSSSDRIPLIAIYCMGVFGLMMLSLLETVFVMYLIEKDNAPQDNETDEDLGLSEDKQGKARREGGDNEQVHSSCDCDVSPTPSEKLAVAKEDSNIQLMEAPYKMKNPVKTMTPEAKPGYWTRVAKRINRVFFICYVLAVTVFLAYLFSSWTLEN